MNFAPVNGACCKSRRIILAIHAMPLPSFVRDKRVRLRRNRNLLDGRWRTLSTAGLEWREGSEGLGRGWLLHGPACVNAFECHAPQEDILLVLRVSVVVVLCVLCCAV